MVKQAWDDDNKPRIVIIDPKLHIKGASKGLIDKQRKVLLGASLASYSHPELEHGPEWQKKLELSRYKLSSRVDLREGDNKQQMEYPSVKQSHTRETHDGIIFRAATAKETRRNVAKEGANAESRTKRLHDNKSYLAEYKEWDREFVPANLMPNHGGRRDRDAAHREALSTKEKQKSQLQFCQADGRSPWMRHKSHTNENHPPIPPQPKPKTLSKWEGNKAADGLIERTCDGPPDPKYSTKQREFWDKTKAYDMVGNGPRGPKIGTKSSNHTHPEMALAMGVLGRTAFDKDLEPEEDRMFRGHMGATTVTKDMKEVMQGRWIGEDIEQFETEHKKVFQGKKGKTSKHHQRITKSKVNLSDPRCAVGGVQFATEYNLSGQKAAEHLYKHPQPNLRFPQDRTYSTVQHNMQHMEFLGPQVMGVPLGSQANHYRPNTVHGSVYNDPRIVRDLGVNMSEYGKPEVWKNLRNPESMTAPDRNLRVTRSQVAMEHLGQPDTNFSTAHKEHYLMPGKERYSNHFQMDKTTITKSNVPMKIAYTDAHPSSDTDRRQPLSHVQFQRPAARHYLAEKRHQTAERTRNASDMILWRTVATAQRAQFNIQDRERPQAKSRPWADDIVSQN